MRNGHHQNNNHKRMRGRHQHNNNNRRNQNPLTRAYESNGPDVKIRGTASTIAEKYIQLARDAQSSGDPVAAENYYQHAEHYFRLIAAAQEQFRQQNPQHFSQPQQGNAAQGSQPGAQPEGNFEEESDDEFQSGSQQNEPYAREQQQPQPYMQQPREQQQNRQQNFQPRQQNFSQPQQNDGNASGGTGNVSGLPSFITGGQQPQAASDQNGQNAQGGQDGFPMHRRRRRHRGNRPDFGQGQADGAQGGGQPHLSEGGNEPQQSGE